MKTLKIAEPIHKELINLQAKFYRETGIKMTLNEIISDLLINYARGHKDDK